MRVAIDGLLLWGRYSGVERAIARLAAALPVVDPANEYLLYVPADCQAKGLEAAGLHFAGMSPNGQLPETVEIADHPWFIGVQYHPELKSRPFAPHPLFASFIAAAMLQSRLV